METFLGEASLDELATVLHARLLCRAARAETVPAASHSAAVDATPAAIAAAAASAAAPGSAVPAIGTFASSDHLPSRGQRALWFLHQLAPESAAYNIARALVVRGPLDIDALERAFQLL